MLVQPDHGHTGIIGMRCQTVLAAWLFVASRRGLALDLLRVSPLGFDTRFKRGW